MLGHSFIIVGGLHGRLLSDSLSLESPMEGQFILGVVLFPSLIVFIWLSVFGNAAIYRGLRQLDRSQM